MILHIAIPIFVTHTEQNLISKFIVNANKLFPLNRSATLGRHLNNEAGGFMAKFIYCNRSDPALRPV